MSLADFIFEAELNDFRDQCPKIVYPDWFKGESPKGHFTLEQLQSFTVSQYDDVQSCIKSAADLSRENQAHNRRQMEHLRVRFVDMMRAFDVDVYKNKSTDTMYAHYEKLFTDIKDKHRLNYTGGYDIRFSGEYQDIVFTASSYTVERWKQDLLLKIRQVAAKRTSMRQKLISSLTYLIENGIDVSHLKSDEEVIEQADKYKRDAGIAAKYPEGTIISNLVCNGKACTAAHGSQFCDCGRTQLLYRYLTGEIEWDEPLFYQLASWDSLPVQSYHHPKVAEPIPF